MKRRNFLSMSAGLAASTLVTPSLALAQGSKPMYRIIFKHDFLNMDFGFIPEARNKPRFNSWNKSYQTAINHVFNAVEAENPNIVAVAGDLNGAHWGVDVDKTGYFGPTNTLNQKLQAVSNAGDFYYSTWKRRFSRRGLKTRVAFGDHEALDNPWDTEFKKKAFPFSKESYIKHFPLKTSMLHPTGLGFQSHTNYAEWLTPDVLLVSIDQYCQIQGEVRTHVTGAVCQWLDTLLTATHPKLCIVMAHTPILMPVRRYHSGGQDLENGIESEFWDVLKKHNVDLYTAGHVHDITASQKSTGPPQICCGCTFPWGTNYMVLDIMDDLSMNIVVKKFDILEKDETKRLWNVSSKRPGSYIKYSNLPSPVGSARIVDKQLIERTGLLKPYTPDNPRLTISEDSEQ